MNGRGSHKPTTFLGDEKLTMVSLTTEPITREPILQV